MVKHRIGLFHKDDPQYNIVEFAGVPENTAFEFFIENFKISINGAQAPILHKCLASKEVVRLYITTALEIDKSYTVKIEYTGNKESIITQFPFSETVTCEAVKD